MLTSDSVQFYAKFWITSADEDMAGTNEYAPTTVKIDGVDITSWLTPFGQEQEFSHVIGSNSGTMLDGTFVEDYITYKVILTFTVMPLDRNDQSALIRLLHKNHLKSVYYFDTELNSYTERTMILSDGPKNKYLGRGSNEKAYWSGIVIQLQEV